MMSGDVLSLLLIGIFDMFVRFEFSVSFLVNHKLGKEHVAETVLACVMRDETCAV